MTRSAKDTRRLLARVGLLLTLCSCRASTAPGNVWEPSSPLDPEEPAQVATLDAARVIEARQSWLRERDEARVAKRRALTVEAAKSPGWQFHESEHYFILSAADDRAFLEDVKSRLEALRGRLVREFPPRTPLGGQNSPTLTVVRICGNRGSFHDYGGPGGSTAYWSLQHQELVFFDDRQGGGRLETTWPAMQQVGVLAYLGVGLGEDTGPLAPWFTNGLAGVFGGMSPGADGRLVLPEVDSRSEDLTARRFGRNFVPLEALLDFGQSEFLGSNDWGAGGWQNNLQAWSFVLFLRTGAESSPDWEERWGGILDRYFEAALSGMSGEEAHAIAFEGVQLAVLESAWQLWVAELTRGIEGG